ncbi:L-glyceraldehyde 3-phosphate reductase [Roseovarius sp. A-2]|uniref:aldo/keto reductase n=1 Tax=Roseovarius sp. A-2 TaxID=1570360 RepID=UPI0009B53EC9|nr:aldo/keto reductase [Roseovarius sp. A-2]GAW36720.1 L-glyceraldehyde 3-phosphate reductase [Roseovarius sp. A-2]
MSTEITSPDGTPASQVAFGTMQFGGTADERASRGMFDACLAAGITHFDTAHLYTDGASETLLGRFAAPHRDRLVIATKAGYSGGAGADNIRAQFDLSRQRLGMDHVDILYLHRFDRDTPLEETLECFADLKSRGQISHVGLSNFAAWQVMKAACIGVRFDLPISVLQPMYSLVKRQAEVEILPMAASEGMVVAGYSPLAGGLLTGKYARGETGRLTGNERYAIRYGKDWMRDAAAGLVEIAAELGTDPATLAVAWASRHPARPVPLISGRSATQIAPSLAAMTFDMDDALYARVAALTPTPPPATDRTEEGG